MSTILIFGVAGIFLVSPLLVSGYRTMREKCHDAESTAWFSFLLLLMALLGFSLGAAVALELKGVIH